MEPHKQGTKEYTGSLTPAQAIEFESMYMSGELARLGVGRVHRLDVGVEISAANQTLQIVNNYLNGSTNFYDPQVFSQDDKNVVLLIPVSGKEVPASEEYVRLKYQLKEPLTERQIDISKAVIGLRNLDEVSTLDLNR